MTVMKGINQKKVQVKICGISDLETALAAIKAGADFLGFNFVKTSRRYIDPKAALEIIKGINGKVKTVGVFQNEAVEKVNKIADLLNLDFVQLHGEEDDGYIEKIKSNVIKKRPFSSLFNRDPKNKFSHILIDREKQGEGPLVDFESIAKFSNKHKLFLSGGLTPGNIKGIVEKVKPFVVDVASGVETDGKKDIAKIREFIKNAKFPIKK